MKMKMITKEFIATDVLDLPLIAKEIIKICEQTNLKMLAFYGEMGAGKTTLIKEIGKVMNVEDTVLSPTFSIVNEYKCDGGNSIFHFDFYRIDTEDQAIDVGCLEYFSSGNYCFIEWSEKIPNLLPDYIMEVSIAEINNHHRKILIKY